MEYSSVYSVYYNILILYFIEYRYFFILIDVYFYKLSLIILIYLFLLHSFNGLPGTVLLYCAQYDILKFYEYVPVHYRYDIIYNSSVQYIQYSIYLLPGTVTYLV